MSLTDSRPFDNSYWVISGKLLVGATPGIWDSKYTHDRLKSLKEFGINSIFNLTEEDETDHHGVPFYNYTASTFIQGLAVYRYPIRDMDIPSPITMARILAQIDQELNAGRSVYVHCWGGLGRTGTVVGCYLLKQKMMNAASVFDRIRELKSVSMLRDYESPQTEAQREFVEEWE